MARSRAAEPGAGAKTRLTEEEEEEEEEAAGLYRMINLRVASPAPKPVALDSGYGLNEEKAANRPPPNSRLWSHG